MLRGMWQVLLNRQGAFHQIKLLNGLNSISGTVRGIIMAFDGDEMHTHASNTTNQMYFELAHIYGTHSLNYRDVQTRTKRSTHAQSKVLN